MGTLIGTIESALIASFKPRQECLFKWLFDRTALKSFKDKILKQDLVKNLFSETELSWTKFISKRDKLFYIL